MRTTGIYICAHVFVLITCPYVSWTKAIREKHTLLMKYTGTPSEAETFGEKIGLTFKKSVLGDDNRWYLFTKFGSPASTNIQDLQEVAKKQHDNKFKSLELEKKLDICRKVVTINDPQWSNQWHLQNAQTPSMNVYNAWDKGYTGSGVIITFLDDGIDKDHTDLAANYNPSYSYDVINDVANPSHKEPIDGHGTMCAGVAAAAKNTNCVIGTAYDATIGGVRIVGNNFPTPSDTAMALTYALSDVDIYSNSWGPPDDGASFKELGSVEDDALRKGVTQGRGGLGAIYTWASGNGGSKDDCNADGYSKSIYTIAVAAVSETTAPAWYSEHCSAILTATYSGDDPNAMIPTTARSNACTREFSGTSSACPLASGVIALTLQANPSLSWRDVQHLIVETSISTGFHENASFATNAAGKEFSHYFGFGLMNAEAMVDAAPTWQSVPEFTSCTYPDAIVSRDSHHTTISESFTVDNCDIEYLEAVVVELDYSGYYRGDVQFELVSPLGTTSIIFSQRMHDLADLTDSISTKFMSVHFWGEDPRGDWTLHMIDKSPFDDTDMRLSKWKMNVYGTVTNPLSGAPATGSLGSSCSSSDDCSSVADGGCLLDGHVCVTCKNNYRIVNTYCVEDGYTNGYCNTTSVPCEFSGDLCVNNVCVGIQDEGSTDESDDSNNLVLIGGAFAAGFVGAALLSGCWFFAYKKLIQPKGRVAPIADPTNRRNANNQSIFSYAPSTYHY